MKKLFSVLLIAVLLLSLCACRPAESKENTLAFVHRYGSGAYDSHLADSFTEAAKALGFAPTVVTPADATATAQKTLIENLIREGVAGIAINANEVSGLETVLKEANDAGIPVITVGADTAGSQLLVQPGSPEMLGKSLMDAILELTDGAGSFAVLAGETPFSGNDPYVLGMKSAAQDSKYEKLIWETTDYSYQAAGGVEQMKQQLTELMNQHPDLEAICCASSGILVTCSQALEEMGAKIRVTGIAQPSQMKDLVGDDRACPFYFMWDPSQVGKCVAHALIAMLDTPTLEADGNLATPAGEYPLYSGYYAPFQIYADAIFRFTGLPTDPIY
jgi:rhamnose transport system substrate-binding protein